MMTAGTEEQMKSPLWRIRNLYSIRGLTGKAEKFVPFPEQEEILHNIYMDGHEKIVIPKARQLGCSTLIAIIILDSMLFGAGLQISIVDKTAIDAKKKLDEKIKYGWENLDPALKARYEVVNSNTEEWRIKRAGAKKEDESVVFAGESARGGTNQILWVSEWGTIGLSDKNRSTEILTGALPSADHPGCLTIVETTWKGGRQGDLWPIVNQAQMTPERFKGPRDWRIKFIAWWTSATYTDPGDASQLKPDTQDYFEKLQRITGRIFSNAQKLWWQKTGETQGMFMGREYPSTLDECFDAPTEGAFFDKEGLEFIHRTIMGPIGARVRFCDIQINGHAADWMPRSENIAPFRVWEDPRDGFAYILSADFCVGKQASGSSGKRDANSWSVWRAARLDPDTREMHPPMKVAACRIDDRCGTPEAVRRIQALARYYGDCMVIPEINNKDNICGQLEAGPNAVKNLWTQRTGADGAMPGQGKTEEVKGWLTTGTRDGGGTRRQMLMTLQEAVREQMLLSADERMYSEMTTFIVNEKGRAEAAPGCFDDTVLEGAIGVHNMRSATVYRKANLQSAQTQGPRDFSRFTQRVGGI
jgi:hypothetical protein